MDKLLQSGRIFETGLNNFDRPNIIELKKLHSAGVKVDHKGSIWDFIITILS